MAIYDVFETAPIAFYSGSYTDRNMIGSPLGIRTGQTASMYNSQRTIIGTSFNRQLVTSSFNTITKWQYSRYSALQYAKQIAGNLRTVSVSEQGTLVFDSVMPDILTVASINGEAIRYGSVTMADVDLEVPAFPSASAASIVIRNTSAWPQRFPFEATYKNLPRIVVQGRKLQFSTGSATNLAYLTFENINGDVFTIMDVSSSNVAVDFLDANVSQLFEDQVLRSLILPIEDYRKLFFGIGDGLEPKAGGLTSLTGYRYRTLPMFRFRHFPDPDFLATPLFRGFKFGVFNANLNEPRAIYRNGRYGNLRDMLEQRLCTATIKVGELPFFFLDIAFTGSTATSASIYSLASSSVSFNQRDNGQWDTHARCGQPFFDI